MLPLIRKIFVAGLILLSLAVYRLAHPPAEPPAPQDSEDTGGAATNDGTWGRDIDDIAPGPVRLR